MNKLLLEIKEYIKIHLVSIILIIISIFIISSWLLPKENKIDQAVNINYNQIADNYDTASGEYKNIQYVLNLQDKVDKIKTESEYIKVIKVGLYSLFLIVIVGLLGTLLQHIYTKLKFTDVAIKENMIVLASVIFSTALVVAVVFYSFMK